MLISMKLLKVHYREIYGTFLAALDIYVCRKDQNKHFCRSLIFQRSLQFYFELFPFYAVDAKIFLIGIVY
jgi:hypothetical protein